MVNPETHKTYKTTIGIECHVQLKTVTKLFSGVGNDARDAPPNTLISHIDLGMPGALPVLNEKAIELASRAAFALGTSPQSKSAFDRKHYFYPDLPMGYQITQFYEPIIQGGVVNFAVEGETKQVRIHEAHLEADAGKSTHPGGKDYSLIDLNRAGTPLLEIVSEPDMHSAVEAKAYAKELYLRMRYADVSDANLFYGNMRFDVNVSVSKDEMLGTRTETKNLNSFRSVEKATDFEINRQIEHLEKGETISQETRGWDEAKQKTYVMRSKEEAHDYRYMSDPDLPPVELSEAFIAQIQSSMPVMPGALREQFKSLGLDSSVTDTLIDEMPAGKLVQGLLDSGCNSGHVKKIANWLASDVQSLVANGEITWESAKLEAASLKQLAELAADNKVSSTNAKVILSELVHNGGDAAQIADRKGLLQVSDEAEIERIVAEVLSANPKAAEDVKQGEMKAIGFLVGQVMKQSQGKANPQLTQELIKKQLS